MNIQRENELIGMSDHLFYEVQMLINTSRALEDLRISSKNGPLLITVRNALVESFAVHTRILLDFLYSRRGHKTDLVADDYFDSSGTWRKARPKMTSLLKSVHSRVGKEIVHLSYDRLKVEAKKKGWSLKISRDLIIVLDQFVCSVPSNRVGTKFSRYINEVSKSDIWADV